MISKEFGGFQTGRNGAITAIVSGNGIVTQFNQLSESLAQYSLDSNGNVTGLISPSGNVPLPLTNTRKRFAFVGDSLTYGGSGRATSVFNGQTWMNSASIVLTNLGAGKWLNYGMVDGTASTGTTSSIQTDGHGNLQWSYNGDSYGPYVNVSNGGWYILQSGTSKTKILVAVRGGTTPPSAATGAVTLSGLKTINDWGLLGYASFVAGQLNDTFSDYECWGITGAVSADILKFLPQVLATNVEAVSLLIGVNDIGGLSSPTAGQCEVVAANAIANIKASINLCVAAARRVYVGDIFPYPGASNTTAEHYLALVSTAIEAYCKQTPGAVFWSSYDRMINSDNFTVSGKTGVYNPSDNLHLMPYGSFMASLDLVSLVQRDYSVERPRKCTIDVYDSVLGVGAWNTNPALRGTGGTVTGGGNITGTCPDSWTIALSGSTQACTTSFTPATDYGISWYTLSVSGATAGDYHGVTQTVSVPSGIAVGSYFRLTCEMQFGACGGAGLAIMQIQANSNGNAQNAYLVESLTSGRNVNTFSTELPVLYLQSEPQILQSGTTNFTLGIRVGADPASGTGVMGFRNFRIEACNGPVYP